MGEDVNPYIKSYRINLWLALIFHILFFRSLNSMTACSKSGQDMIEEFPLCQQHFIEHFIVIIKITDFYKVFKVFYKPFLKVFCSTMCCKSD